MNVGFDSKAFEQRLEGHRAIASFFQTSTLPKAVDRIEEELGEFVRPGESMPDVAFLLELLRRKDEHDFNQLREAHQEIFHRQHDLSKACDKRDKWGAKLRGSLLDLQKLIEINYGTEGLLQILMKARMARRWSTLKEQGKLAAKRLCKGALPPLRDPGRAVQVDPKTVGENLAAEVRELDTLYTAAGHAQKDLETGQMFRNKALKGYDRTYLGLHAFLGSFLRLAGMPKAVKLVGASLRKLQRSFKSPVEDRKETTPTELAAEKPAPEAALTPADD